MSRARPRARSRSGAVRLVVCLAVALAVVPSGAAGALGDGRASQAAPTGVRAYLSTPQGIVPFDLATRTVVTTIPLPSQDIRMAISADGRTAWVLGREEGWVRAVTLGTGAVGPAIPLGGAGSSVALAPDGRTAWVSLPENGTLVPVDTGTPTAGAPVPVLVNGTRLSPRGLAITVDGSTALVAGGCDQGFVAVVGLRERTVRGAFRLPTDLGYPCPSDVTVAPGSLVALAGDAHSGAGLSTLDLATRTVQGTVSLGGSGTGQIVVTPDGRKAYTSGGIVDLRAGQVVGSFAPSQPPVARFTARVGADGVVQLDARRSAGRTSPIARYDWSVDGGGGISSSSPRTTLGLSPGKHTIRLTVTDASGTSRYDTWASRQWLRNGGPSATTTRSVTAL